MTKTFEKLFESLDEKVFTSELKENLKVQFNEAVESKATEITESKIEAEVKALNEKNEEHIELLNEKSEEYVEAKKVEMLEALDKYLDRVVEEFIQEAEEALEESAKSEKAEMIIEAFEAMLTATGVEIATIVEAKDKASVEAELKESTDKFDALVEENIELKEENETLIKMGAISELKEGLSIVEAEKFEKLAALVEFTKDDEFIEKLETIKESIKGSKETEALEENAEVTDEASDWDHLV